jgi:hypothetical protein
MGKEKNKAMQKEYIDAMVKNLPALQNQPA